MDIIPVILCGGSGSRLWPLSRELDPKPFIKLNNGYSLLQNTILRAMQIPQVNDIMLIANDQLSHRIQAEISECTAQSPSPNFHIITEPVGRNTAPAIAVAAHIAQRIAKKDNVLLLILAADHIIDSQELFNIAVSSAIPLANNQHIITFGIQPTFPETGYGYIEYDGTRVLNFKEKPDLQKAQHYIASGRFLWNSGMFLFQADLILKEISRFRPDIATSVEKTLQNTTFNRSGITSLNKASFESIPEDSIDYAVMEKSSCIRVIPCSFKWNDIGSWNALGALEHADAHGNHFKGNVLPTDTYNTIVYGSDRLIATIGINDLIIVDTPDAVLISTQKDAQKVKGIYNHLISKGQDVAKVHNTAYRPWGSYTVLIESPGFKVKRVEVKPGGQLSLQHHEHRSEHWVVVEGEAEVINGTEHLRLKQNESTYIPAKNLHRLTNPTDQLLVIVEVQCGAYLGEDDIVRHEDVYNRISRA